jgi:hypothetical protein
MGKTGSIHHRNKAYKILVTKPEVTRPFGRLRYRWDDNTHIMMNLRQNRL